MLHGERWQEVESHDERLIVTIPRMPADVARVVFVDDVVRNGMASPDVSAIVVNGAPD